MSEKGTDSEPKPLESLSNQKEEDDQNPSNNENEEDPSENDLKSIQKVKSRTYLKRKSKKVVINQKLNWKKVRSRIDCWGPKSPPATMKTEEDFNMKNFIIGESPIKSKK